jgi:hypothetical protein
MATPDRTQWTDPALNREFERVYKQINGTPEKMVRLEEATKALANVVQDLREDVERQQTPGWTRAEKIGTVAVFVSLLGSAAAGAAVIF